MMWTMGSSGGWKARGPSARPACSLKGLAGRSCSAAADLVLGLEGDGEGQAGNFGASLGLLGTRFLPVRDSVDDRWGVAQKLSEPSGPSPLRPGLGLGGASAKIFLCSRGLS